MLAEEPLVARRVDHAGAALFLELFISRFDGAGRAGPDGTVVQTVHGVDVEEQCCRLVLLEGAATTDHDPAVADLQLEVLATATARGAVGDLGVERRFEEPTSPSGSTTIR